MQEDSCPCPTYDRTSAINSCFLNADCPECRHCSRSLVQPMRTCHQPRSSIRIRYHRRPYRDVYHIPFDLLEQERLLPRGLPRNLENSLILQMPFAELVARCHCRDDNVAHHFFYRCGNRLPPTHRRVQKYWQEQSRAQMRRSISENAYCPRVQMVKLSLFIGHIVTSN